MLVGNGRALHLNTPQPIIQADPVIVLDQAFAENAQNEMLKLGARNATPPLPPSTHLKNVKTGVIFPWSRALAEQRDVLVNCDANGNTDPAAWQRTIQSENEVPDQSELMQKAYANLSNPQPFMQTPPPQMNEQGKMPYGAQTLDKYLDTVPELTPESEQTLNQLSQMME